MTLKELATEELRRSLSTQDFVISVLRTAILTSVFAPGATLRQADGFGTLKLTTLEANDSRKLTT